MGGEGEWRADETSGSESARETVTATGVNTAAGGASWTAAAVVAAESADSMWQQEPGELRAVLSDASGPWQHPEAPASAPSETGPRWQKHSPADAFSNAAAMTATPTVRSRGFMKLSLA
jgi:hypothetical protein